MIRWIYLKHYDLEYHSYETIVLTEYCNGEKFEPKCDSGDIIIMQSAIYGRIKLGRCIPTDFGYLGCQSDVLAQFDQECSGKESCSIYVGDNTIPEEGGCLKGLSRSLTVQYSCAKGEK